METDTITVPVRLSAQISKEYMDSWQEIVYRTLKEFTSNGMEITSNPVKIGLTQADAYVLLKMIEAGFILDKRPTIQ